MGQDREARLPQAQFGNPPRQFVRLRCFLLLAPHFNSRRQLESQQFQAALTLIDNLLTELKRLDDKMILTEVHLLESRVYRGVGNFPKAKVRPSTLQ